MITKIKIENFKSISSLELDLGRLNIFIGSNGSGKSNILEGIAMGAAASTDNLEDQFLASRGIRVTDHTTMRSGFSTDTVSNAIAVNFSHSLYGEIPFILEHQDNVFSDWWNSGKTVNELMTEKIKNETFVETTEGSTRKLNAHEFKKIEYEINEKTRKAGKRTFGLQGLSDFLIFAPENHFLRRFEEESQIKPLGIKGEGLFRLLTIITSEKPEQLEKIKDNLQLLDWFDNFEIPKDLKFTERRLNIKDRYLTDGLQYLDQRSANEGFLYLLFYFTLFISDYTPNFFAIDNIDNAMNPKLGRRLIKTLALLANKNKKQALLTTHNPAILDGLNLNDDEQRLFVVYRNGDGHTKVRRIFKKKMPEGVTPMPLSEMFLRGYIGGLPNNF